MYSKIPNFFEKTENPAEIYPTCLFDEKFPNFDPNSTPKFGPPVGGSTAPDQPPEGDIFKFNYRGDDYWMKRPTGGKTQIYYI